MSIRNLDKIFEPHRIAVIGASDTPTSVGYTVLRNLVGSGFRGVVYPVNSKREAIQGIQAYKDISSLPHAPDLAVICTPAPTYTSCASAMAGLAPWLSPPTSTVPPPASPETSTRA